MWDPYTSSERNYGVQRMAACRTGTLVFYEGQLLLLEVLWREVGRGGGGSGGEGREEWCTVPECLTRIMFVVVFAFWECYTCSDRDHTVQNLFTFMICTPLLIESPAFTYSVTVFLNSCRKELGLHFYHGKQTTAKATA